MKSATNPESFITNDSGLVLQQGADMHIVLLWSAPFGRWQALWIIPQPKPHHFCRVCISLPEAFCFYHPTAAIAAPAHRSHIFLKRERCNFILRPKKIKCCVSCRCADIADQLRSFLLAKFRDLVDQPDQCSLENVLCVPRIFQNFIDFLV